MTRQVVRNLASNETHLADVETTTAAVQFGATYRKPPTDTEALCGVRIKNGVVMREGTKLRCRFCRHFNTYSDDEDRWEGEGGR